MKGTAKLVVHMILDDVEAFRKAYVRPNGRRELFRDLQRGRPTGCKEIGETIDVEQDADAQVS